MSSFEGSFGLADRDGYGGGHGSYDGGYGYGSYGHGYGYGYGLDPISVLALLTFLAALTYLTWWCIRNPNMCLPKPNMPTTPATTSMRSVPTAPLDSGFEAVPNIWDYETTTVPSLYHLGNLPLLPWGNFSGVDNLLPIPGYL